MRNSSAVNTVLDSCCQCGFVFVDKKRKRSGEFAEIFANVCNEKTRDGFPRAVCGTCKGRIEKLIFVRDFCGFLCSRAVRIVRKSSCCGRSG